MLDRQGYAVARRTVAKYRAMEGILPAHLRMQSHPGGSTYEMNPPAQFYTLPTIRRAPSPADFEALLDLLPVCCIDPGRQEQARAAGKCQGD